MTTRRLTWCFALLTAAALCRCVSTGVEPSSVSILCVFDDRTASPELKSGDGFGCVIRTPGTTILFDTGYSGVENLMFNMEKMKIDPREIDTVFISHAHLEAGLWGFLDRNPEVVVYVPRPFTRTKKPGTEYREVDQFQQLSRNIYSTGTFDSIPPEHSLVIDTVEGLVVVCGCAHPGIIEILQAIKERFPNRELLLVMGGFHLRAARPGELESIVAEFRKMGVKRVAPFHCSGNAFREVAKRVYQEDYVDGRVGQIIAFD